MASATANEVLAVACRQLPVVLLLPAAAAAAAAACVC